MQSLDYASAVTNLDSQNTTLSAAMQAYTLTQGLSLFKYLQGSEGGPLRPAAVPV